MDLEWYWHRLSRMKPRETASRVREGLLKQVWRVNQRSETSSILRPPSVMAIAFAGASPELDPCSVPRPALERLLEAAEHLLLGQWCVFGKLHPSLGDKPNWFIDARSGREVSREDYSFDIQYRDEAKVGNIKYIWEPSRHHHLTVLAAAYAITKDERYAERIALHLKAWWKENPFLSGPHWISGIELGIRLISWVWVRRLLTHWSDATSLFENNPKCVEQLYQHQRWLASFQSHGSSANNHLVAEAAGQFIASCAFPIFAESVRWREQAAEILEKELVRQTFPSGLNRELATGYHGFVLELALAAAVEGKLCRHPLSSVVWERIRAMMDALASIVDCKCQPPRQGDSDDGIGLLLDDPTYNRWNALLATGRRLFGASPWWPKCDDNDIRTEIWTSGIATSNMKERRAPYRTDIFEDAGQVFLRAGGRDDEIWCRCDHGPHGFLSIAAHAHADALSVELRVGGIEILVDPGTYCYHGDSDWRQYFRSTIAHNTVEVMGRCQSKFRGPFLWTEQAQARLLKVDGLDENSKEARWQAEHGGYVKRGGPVHRRTVVLNRECRVVTVCDALLDSRENKIPVRLAFHFGPDICCKLTSSLADLVWPSGAAEVQLPQHLTWSLHRGRVTPLFGWFSPSFDVKVPSFSILGSGMVPAGSSLTTTLHIRHTEAERQEKRAS